MGSYTTNFKFYKPEANEVVDVEQQLNYNWDICDKQMRRLLEYEYVTSPTPNVVGALSRSRFYKEYSNSIMAYFTAGNFFWQDPVAFVSPWVNANLLLEDGWFEQEDNPLCYRIIKKSGGTTAEVEWSGSVWTGGTFIDLNTNITLMPSGGMPAEIRPAVSKYFVTSAGNTATNYSVSRLFFGNSGLINFVRYGVNPSVDSPENRIEFNGVRYNVEVTGT